MVHACLGDWNGHTIELVASRAQVRSLVKVSFAYLTRESLRVPRYKESGARVWLTVLGHTCACA